MSRLIDLYLSAQDYRTAELITGALQDIGSSKMQAIRKQFESNARFFAGIREVYGIVKAHALALAESEEEAPAMRRHRSGRDLYIALTSNKRFYGMLNRNIIRSFLEAIRSARNESDFLVIGQTGAQYLKETTLRNRLVRVQFADDAPTDEELYGVLSIIGGYRRVFVVYPKFINPFRQDIAMSDITETPAAQPAPELRADYIFEPEIPDMLDFFEAQVRRILFERVLLESELARSAARTMKMRDARTNATDLRVKFEHGMRREYETIADIQLMETLSGYQFWKQL